jgi:branched-subunit amino acid aminotransferase/4-amino-4-deoxychorismate lyase
LEWEGGKGNVASVSVEFAPWLGVFETVRVIDGAPLFVAEHAAELRRAAAALELEVKLDFPGLIAGLPRRSGRWRWIVRSSDTETFFVEEAAAAEETLDLSLASVRVGSQNWDARFKTLSYLTHAQALREATTSEVVLLNEHREVAGAARANIFWRQGERLFTPAPGAGCRCGVVRGFILGRREVEEGRFSFDDLLQADEIFLTNSMRGIVSVRFLEGRSLESFTTADALRVEYGEAVRKQIALRS